MSNGPGVSLTKRTDGRWRVRWRNTVIVDGKIQRLPRERVVSTHATAIELQATILKELETKGVYEQAIPVHVTPATLDDVWDAWMGFRAEEKQPRAGTLLQWAARCSRILRILREVNGLPEGQPVPMPLLTADAVSVLVARMRQDGLTQQTIHGTIGSLHLAWAFAASKPKTYAGVEPPGGMRPRTQTYTAMEAPTYAECDVILHTLRYSSGPTGTVALPASVIARCTGLRISQILGIRVADVYLDDAEGPTLRVRVGKGERETAEQREIPLSIHLAEYLRTYMVDRNRTEFLIPSRKPGCRADIPRNTLARAWEQAVEDKLVRAEVWKDEEKRKNGRPDHAFRAAFQSHLVEHGVQDSVIDKLVGHSEGLRARHYVSRRPYFPAMREAVALIPAIDWTGGKP